MRLPIPLPLLAILAAPAPLVAQGPPLPAADSALVGRVLLAEDRRDTSDAALREGLRHADARVRTLARRAYGRIVDPRFVARDSLPPLRPPPAWPDPAWRLRYRALAAQRTNCGALRAALADSAWPVRLRAIDLTPIECATDDRLASTFRAWVDALPADAARRERGGVSWHAAAHALVALARVRPEEARPRLRRLASHRQWQVRAYAARAAAALSDTARLRSLTRDPNDNVKEVAIEALAKLGGHAHDDVFLTALGARGAQAVRAAAIALKGSPRAGVASAANATFERWAARGNASERDVRLALLEAAARPTSDDRPPPARAELPPRTVALALGEEVRLRVTMAPSSGGGWFDVQLRGDVAPMMAGRVLALARDGYYDATSWHRVEHDFVIQGGGPGANEYVGHPRFFRDELGTVPHLRGTVGMSTRGHDTGDAQWFINLKDNVRLGRDYTVFAEVVAGIEVVDGILEGDAIATVAEVTAAPETPVTVGTGEWAVGGILTLPHGRGPFPAVVLMHGSGPGTRDGDVGPNRIFRETARALAERGVAVLRYDKRTTAHEARFRARGREATLDEEHVDDGVAAVRLLQRTPGIDPRRVFLLAASQSTTVAADVALRAGGVPGVILVAVGARRPTDMITEQVEYGTELARQRGDTANERRGREVLATVRRVATADPSDTLTLFGKPVAYWHSMDPQRTWRDAGDLLDCGGRILVVSGGRDYLTSEADFEAWKRALAGRRGVTFKRYSDLNHMMQPGAGKMTPAEYGERRVVSPQYLADVAAWVTSQPRRSGTCPARAP